MSGRSRVWLRFGIGAPPENECDRGGTRYQSVYRFSEDTSCLHKLSARFSRHHLLWEARPHDRGLGFEVLDLVAQFRAGGVREKEQNEVEEPGIDKSPFKAGISEGRDDCVQRRTGCRVGEIVGTGIRVPCQVPRRVSSAAKSPKTVPTGKARHIVSTLRAG